MHWLIFKRANNIGIDQTADPHSLFTSCIIRSLLIVIVNMQNLIGLASLCKLAVANSEDRFSRNEVQNFRKHSPMPYHARL